jgi:cell division inhibitor SepF
MSFMDEFKKIIHPYDGEDEFEEEEFDQPKADRALFDDRKDDRKAEDRRNKVVNIHATAQLKVVLVKPERFENASEIADHLREKRTVVLNLEKTSKEASRRLIDFLTGVAYSIGGDLRNIATNAYVITPSNVDVENAKIRTTPRQPQPAEPEPEDPAPAGDFNDFN